MKSRLPRYLRRVWRDTRLPDGAFVTLLELKARATLGVIRISMRLLARARHCSLSQIKRHIAILVRLRIILIRHNSSRGNLSSSTYLLDDERFAKYLSETARPRKKKKGRVKNELGVPTVLKTLHGSELDILPDNVVQMPNQSGIRCAL